MTPDKTLPASIYIPEINDYVEIVGGKCQIIDGKPYLRIACKTSIGTELLMNPSDLEIYFKRNPMPF